MAIKRFFKGFKEGFLGFGKNTAIIVNCILLSLVYVFGVGITSVAAKLTGKHFIPAGKEIDKKSYWCPLSSKKMTKDDDYRQF